jgi:hypothetical protein
MHWLDVVNRDPVPWLLDPSNPSVRYLTLKRVFKAPPSKLAAEQQRMLEWEPVRTLIDHWDRTNYWGRLANPYYGGAMGNFGTLYLLYQLGVPRFPRIEPVCENLLQRGRTPEGYFMSETARSKPWLCYTGMALEILTHFGYGGDDRTRSSWRALIQAILHNPDNLACPLADNLCQDALVKVLKAFLLRPAAERSDEEHAAMDWVRTQLTDYAAVIHQGGERSTKGIHFPRHDRTDELELGRALARTRAKTHPRVGELLEDILRLQDENGRWPKQAITPELTVEGIQKPSRWLTLEAVHTVMLIYGGNAYAA